MPKSNLQLLQEAIAANDWQRAKELTDKLSKNKTPRKAAKAPVAKKVPKSKKAPKVERQPSRHDLTVHELEESEYLAPSRAPGSDGVSGRRFLGADGKEHTYAKRVSMQGTKFVNKFDPSQYDRLPPKLEKFDRKQQRKKKTVAARPPAKQIKIRCSICREEVSVYPWEAETVDGESSFRCSKRSCVKAR